MPYNIITIQLIATYISLCFATYNTCSSKISSLYQSFVEVHQGSYQTWPESPQTGFLVTDLSIAFVAVNYRLLTVNNLGDQNAIAPLRNVLLILYFYQYIQYNTIQYDAKIYFVIQATCQYYKTIKIQVTHSRTGRRISHGYNPASFVAIRIDP